MGENSHEQNRNTILRKIYERLSNPEVKQELHESIKKIEEIYGYPIDISLIIGGTDPIEMDTFSEDSYDYMMNQDYKQLLEKTEEKTMSLKDFIFFLSEEENDLKVCIDPLYLKKGRNDIHNVLLTTFEDKVIIVPKPIDENGKENNSGN